MAFDTYANLQIAIGAWLNRGDLTANTPDFIALAEAQLARKLTEAWNKGLNLPRAMVTRITNFSIASEMVNLPADFLGPLAFTIDASSDKLRYIDPETLAHEKARVGTTITPNLPLAYSIVGAQFQFLPAPDQTYTGTLVYWQKFTALSGSNPSNWILANHPDVYLYGALLASAPFLKDDARVAMWGTLFAAAIDDLLRADPIPNDGSLLRSDEGLWFFNRRRSFNITSGDFV